MLVAGTHSGVGKTTVATGLMAALSRRGTRVRAAKVGPDYIDPGYHRLATGAPSRNLDSFLAPPGLIPTLARRAADGGDLLVVEGVMGLFDGAGPVAGPARAAPVAGPAGSSPAAPAPASTAEVALLTRTPVVLVVDCSAVSQSVAAVVHGFATFSQHPLVQAVVLNRVASEAHEEGLRRALEPLGLPVLGALRRDDAMSWRDRHLGLVPVAERPAEITAALDRLADAIAAALDLDAVVRLAAAAPGLPSADPWQPAVPVEDGPAGRRPRIAVAGGPAFSFVYPETIERFAEAGAEAVPLDPLADPALPEDVDGLYVGGGFPEVHAAALSENRRLLADVAAFASAGGPIWAECGGLLWLSKALDGKAQCGVVDATGAMTRRLHLGYRTTTALVDNPVLPAGAVVRGHEFHYSTLDPPGAALTHDNGRDAWREGHATPSMLATFLHQHLASDPSPAERFVAAAADFGRSRQDS